MMKRASEGGHDWQNAPSPNKISGPPRDAVTIRVMINHKTVTSEGKQISRLG